MYEFMSDEAYMAMQQSPEDYCVYCMNAERINMRYN